MYKYTYVRIYINMTISTYIWELTKEYIHMYVSINSGTRLPETAETGNADGCLAVTAAAAARLRAAVTPGAAAAAASPLDCCLVRALSCRDRDRVVRSLVARP